MHVMDKECGGALCTLDKGKDDDDASESDNGEGDGDSDGVDSDDGESDCDASMLPPMDEASCRMCCADGSTRSAPSEGFIRTGMAPAAALMYESPRAAGSEVALLRTPAVSLWWVPSSKGRRGWDGVKTRDGGRSTCCAARWCETMSMRDGRGDGVEGGEETVRDDDKEETSEESDVCIDVDVSSDVDTSIDVDTSDGDGDASAPDGDGDRDTPCERGG